MLELFLSLNLCAGTALILWGGLRSPNRLSVAGYDPQGLGMGLLAILAAGYFFGPLYGAALILSVMIHEFGHVAAYRICGHADARFRLVPLLGGVAISSQAPASQEKDFFITLMGPGICLAPMVTAYALSDLLDENAPAAADFLWIFAQVTAALNFFNLLPIWPLDGGRCVRILVSTYWPAGTRYVTYAMSGAMVAGALWMQSLLLLFFAIASARGLTGAETLIRLQRPMSWRRGALAFLAYAFTIAAHFMGGYALLERYI